MIEILNHIMAVNLIFYNFNLFKDTTITKLKKYLGIFSNTIKLKCFEIRLEANINLYNINPVKVFRTMMTPFQRWAKTHPKKHFLIEN